MTFKPRSITDELFDVFGVLFDEWSENKMHFVIISVTQSFGSQNNYTMIVFALLLKDEEFGDDQHVQIIDGTLDVSERTSKTL